MTTMPTIEKGVPLPLRTADIWDAMVEGDSTVLTLAQVRTMRHVSRNRKTKLVTRIEDPEAKTWRIWKGGKLG